MSWIVAAKEAVQAGKGAALVTVVHSAGSTPRETGAKMVVLADRIVGSIGGGQMEFEAIDIARAMMAERDERRRIVRRILGPDLGQCCGGAVSLLIETLGARDKAWLMDAMSGGQRGDTGWLITTEASDKAWVRHTDANIAGALSDVGAMIVPGETGWRVVEKLGDGATPVWVFGAGHVGTAIVKILAELPFKVCWLDSRQNAMGAMVPAGVEARRPERLAEHVASAPSGTFFLVMTHSHELDYDICDRILRRGDFAFLGLIGSATKRARFVKRYKERGASEALLTRLVCPIGLGGVPGKQPMAIAVATAGQLLVLRERQKQSHDALPGQSGLNARDGAA